MCGTTAKMSIISVAPSSLFLDKSSVLRLLQNWRDAIDEAFFSLFPPKYSVDRWGSNSKRGYIGKIFKIDLVLINNFVYRVDECLLIDYQRRLEWPVVGASQCRLDLRASCSEWRDIWVDSYGKVHHRFGGNDCDQATVSVNGCTPPTIQFF